MQFPLRPALALLALALALALVPRSGHAFIPTPHTLTIDANKWRVIERESGKDNYYTIASEGVMPPFIRARYRPPMATAVLGYQTSGDQSKAQVVRWQWRALTLPAGGNECEKGKGDSAAVVYLTWRRGLKYYTIKYVWSAVGPKGATCDRHNNPFSAQDTVVLQSGGPLAEWQSEEVDLRAEFRKHFADGKPDADVPDFIGIGLMSDGDQTKSDSSADYAGVTIGW
jgi:hypothetical protein